MTCVFVDVVCLCVCCWCCLMNVCLFVIHYVMLSVVRVLLCVNTCLRVLWCVLVCVACCRDVYV